MPQKATTSFPREALAGFAGHDARAQHGLAGEMAGGAGFVFAHEHDRIRARDPGGDGLAQGPGRDHALVAEAVAAVDDDECQILRERRILEAVVHHDAAGARRDGGAGAGRAIARDPRRRHLGEQQRLIADGSRIVAGRIDADGPRRAPAIAAREEMRIAPRRGEHARQRQRHRRFPRAADADIADANDRHGRAPAAAAHAQARGERVDAARRHQQRREHAAARPEIRRPHRALPGGARRAAPATVRAPPSRDR